MHAEDAGYRRLNRRVRTALRAFERLLSDDTRRAYFAMEEAVNERDSYRLDSVAQFAFAVGYRAAMSPQPSARARKRSVRALVQLRQGNDGISRSR
jgi:hypothetical protein